MQELVDKLVNGVVAGPDDLMGIGECLNLLDELEKNVELSSRGNQNLEHLRRLFNGIILEQTDHPDADWQTIQQLIAEVCNGGSEEEPEAENFFLDDADPAEEDWQEPLDTTPTSDSVEFQDTGLLRDFLDEAKEHLASIELNILSLEAEPDDQEAVSAIFRPFHSIKGVAGFLNLKDIHGLTHGVENLLDEVRSGQLCVSDTVVDLILQAVDMLKGLLADVEISLHEEAPLPDASQMTQGFLERLRTFQEQAAGGADDQVGGAGREESGAGDDLVPGEGTNPPAVARPLDEPVLQDQSPIIAADEAVSNGERQRVKANGASVRVDTFKLDNLVDIVGELVIAQSMVLQNPGVQSINDQKLQKDSTQLHRITNEVQRIAMSMRMVPIKSTFQKLIRLVRDLSRKSGKDVKLVMKGEETEIDRNMVEEIYEPLVHMIRNAIDHGLEPPDERAQAGKNPQGTIVLAAEQKGGNIVIDIRDDGRGLDAEKIRATAIRRGILAAEEQLDERAVYELICHAGFSTKEKVTDISGRGVGMDVVKKSIEQLRGKMEIFSVLGQGSHFQFKLPLTMAIIDGMIIRVGNERYVVPTIALQESLRPNRDAYMTVQGKGEIIKVRDNLMPLIRLHRVLAVEPHCQNPWEGLLLVVNEDNRFYCLLADEIVGRQEVVIKSLGSSLRRVVGISGGAILGDGKVTLIIDVKGVISHYKEMQNDDN